MAAAVPKVSRYRSGSVCSCRCFQPAGGFQDSQLHRRREHEKFLLAAVVAVVCICRQHLSHSFRLAALNLQVFLRCCPGTGLFAHLVVKIIVHSRPQTQP